MPYRDPEKRRELARFGRDRFYAPPCMEEQRRFWVILWSGGPEITTNPDFPAQTVAVLGPMGLIDAVSAFIEAGGLACDLENSS